MVSVFDSVETQMMDFGSESGNFKMKLMRFGLIVGRCDRFIKKCVGFFFVAKCEMFTNTKVEQCNFNIYLYGDSIECKEGVRVELKY